MQHGAKINSREFGLWMKAHGFGARLPRHSHAMRRPRISWRSGLSETGTQAAYQSAIGCPSLAEETESNGKCLTDLKREAKAAWKRFV
jgi:hypothetical protein